jgi:hypothetical protein
VIDRFTTPRVYPLTRSIHPLPKHLVKYPSEDLVQVDFATQATLAQRIRKDGFNRWLSIAVNYKSELGSTGEQPAARQDRGNGESLVQSQRCLGKCKSIHR